MGINLTKEVKDLYTEHYKALTKEIEETQIKEKILSAHGWREFILLKYPYYSN